MIIRKKIDANTLLNIYDTCNRVFDSKDCFYTEQELSQKMQDKNIIALQQLKPPNKN